MTNSLIAHAQKEITKGTDNETIVQYNVSKKRKCIRNK